MKVIKTRKVKGPEHVARMREMRNGYNILVPQPEGKTPLGNLA
jgi:hypothetical protein